jgi:hypothetical protein
MEEFERPANITSSVCACTAAAREPFRPLGNASYIATLCPSCMSVSAATSPEGPAPMITISGPVSMKAVRVRGASSDPRVFTRGVTSESEVFSNDICVVRPIGRSCHLILGVPLGRLRWLRRAFGQLVLCMQPVNLSFYPRSLNLWVQKSPRGSSLSTFDSE